MSLRVRFEAEAAVEVQEAAAWYELQRPGLGLALLAAIDRAVEHIADWPDAGSHVDGLAVGLAVRRAAVTGFPYYLAYLLTPDGMSVIAVAHTRRRPGYWRLRVSDPP